MHDDQTNLGNGWLRLDHVSPLGQYWLDGFPQAQTLEEENIARGRERRMSPIYDYDDGGIGAVQWLQPLTDTALILQSDGGWKTGGMFHLWVCNGAGSRPREITELVLDNHCVEKGDPTGWSDRRDEAVEAVETFFGLRT